MPIKITVSEVNKARAELKKALNELMTDKFVTVGVHEDSAARGGPINNATLGAILHFGNNSIPARPFLDVGVATANEQYVEIIANSDGDLDKALNQIGVVAVGAVQGYMVKLKEPPNAPGTVAIKRSSNPLIDTGNLRQSITYQITNGEPAEGIG